MNYNKELHDEIIKKSHKRSEEYGVEKDRIYSKKILVGKEISSQIRANKGLIRVASPFMKILYDFLLDTGFIIVLTDKDGCILNLIGDKQTINAGRDLDMVIGAYMDEKSIGTNAMGTAIKENSPVQISAKEHFVTAYHRWTCSAAPIHDVDGSIIGTLNLTGNSDFVHPHTLGLVVAAVKSIENQLQNNEIQLKLTEAYEYMKTIMDSISLGIFSIDKDGIIRNINEAACSMLKIEKGDILNNSAEKIISNWSKILNKFKEGKICQDEEVSFKNLGIKDRYNMNAYPIEIDKNIIGVVIILKEIQKVFNLVNKYTGMQARYTFDNLIGESRSIKNLIEYSKVVANSTSTILIQGESGTGKEVLAQSIHNYSNRRENGFVAINCGAISSNLIESELFGYDDGAFTGAKKGGHPGKFELANGGTLFLDEIGEMPYDMQVKLLRVLQEGCITRVGGTRYIPVDVRIIAATNKKLKEEANKEKFRSDLYYRLSVITIDIPSLIDRKEDIPLLINYFLNIKAEKLKKSVPIIKNDVYNHMLKYDWPGNIRELENYIENIVNFNGDIPSIMDRKSENFIENNDNNLTNDNIDEAYILPLEEIEKRAIKACILKCDGNMTRASKILGISRNTLYCKIKKYNIEGLK